MSYEKQNFTNNQILTADHLNHIENGIDSIEQALDGKSSKLFYNDTEKEVGLTFSRDNMNYVTEAVEMGMTLVAYNIDRLISLNTQTEYNISVEYNDGVIESFNGKPIILQLPDGGQAPVIQITKMNGTGTGLEAIMMIISNAKYSENVTISNMAPFYDPNSSAFAFMGPNAQNFKSFTLIGPSQFEVNNVFFNEYKFVTENDKRYWNNKADKEDLYSITQQYVDMLLVNATMAVVEDNNIYVSNHRYQKVNIFNNANIIFPEVDTFTKIHLYFDTTEDLVINLPDCRKKQLPEILANKSYELIATYNMNYWLVEINVFE